MVRRAEFWGGLFWLAFGVFITWQGWLLDLGSLREPGSGFVFFWLGLVVVGAAFGYEHTIVRPHDLSRLNRAFFTVNGFIGIALFACALLDLVVRGLTV